jgi:hypothetical protein
MNDHIAATSTTTISVRNVILIRGNRMVGLKTSGGREVLRRL